MTTISNDDGRRLADLSGLQLTNEELENLDLENIIKYIEQLGELDTSGVEPTYQVTGLANVWRTDKVEPELDRETLLDLAPEQQNHQVKVPQVL